ncbi:MAG TPA: CHAT domain-containing protein [Candidatus Angelobacter sp.]|nr:CHAT domain-containing protein [Candidatus Angelobacter sp.]
MRPPDAHLSPSELASLLLEATDRDDLSSAERGAEREAQQHLDGCAVCQEMATKYFKVDATLASLRAQSLNPVRVAVPSAECPAEETWLRLATGLLDQAAASLLVAHAAQCAYCGPLLREAMEDLKQEIAPEEQAALARLPSAGAAWQRQLAKKLAGGSVDESVLPSGQRETAPQNPTVVPTPLPARTLKPETGRNFAWWPRAVAAAGLAAIVAIAATVWFRTREPDVNHLLAQAYTEQRTEELRIADAGFAPMRVERGPAGGAQSRSLLSRPASLLRAEELIAAKLAARPFDAYWLHAKARADLLDGHYEAAMESLQRALESDPGAPQLLTDLATAYAQRARTTHHPEDDGKAIELLGTALARTPDDAVALFNRAVICERFFLYTQAQDDWQRYLRLDPNGPWADDARRRLADLQQRMEKRKQSLAAPLLSPSELAKSGLNDEVKRQVNDRLEEYMLVALTDWLPRAYPADARAEEGSSNYRNALGFLATLASAEHNDVWLKDLLEASSSSSFPAALDALASAIRDNDRGDNMAARRDAGEAERFFRRAGNPAGALRARVEYLFGLHDAQQGIPCLQAARGLEDDLRAKPYGWLQTQFHLEEGTCYGLSGNLGQAEELYRQAAGEAETHRYPVIFLRTQDHLSGLNGAAGNLSASWERTEGALSRFWSGTYPPMRGYNLYYNLYEFSRFTRQPHLEMAAWRDGLALSESFPDNILRAMAHSVMGDAAISAQEPAVAEVEFRKAGALFGASPQIKSTRIARIDAETRLASVHAAQGDAREALELLQKLAPELEELSDTALPVLFYTTLGAAQAEAGHGHESEAALLSAISFSERQIRSLPGEKARLQWIQQSSAAYRNLVQLRLRQGDVRGSLELWEWYRGAAQRAANQDSSYGATFSTIGAQLNRLHEVADQLPSLQQGSYISLALLPKGVAVWIYDSRGIDGKWVETDPASLVDRIERFRSLCADPGSAEADIRRSAGKLYDILLAPIEPRLSGQRALLFEADDELGRVPFEALVDGRGRFLGEVAPVVVAPPLYDRAGLRSSVPITNRAAALVVAVPESQALALGSLSTLPDAIAEGEMVQQHFQLSQMLRGKEATTASVLSRLAHVQVFHFAGHAFNLRLGTVLLLSDAPLGPASLQRGRFPRLQLAVLSACDTQDGPAGNYDPDGLVRTFLKAGVPHVIASRWNVDSVTTLEFMKLFYQSLLDGKSVSESIRRAEIELRSRPGTSHPYFWSAFSAFGAT